MFRMKEIGYADTERHEESDMPLFDHFRPPVKSRLPWPTLHSGWMSEIAGRLNEILPASYVALERLYIGSQFEIDVATIGKIAEHGASSNGSHGGVVTLPRIYVPPQATATVPSTFPEIVELRVFSEEGSGPPVAAIELVSPANKDAPETRKAFVSKVATYLHSGISVVVMDVVTKYRANMHNELCTLFDLPAEAEMSGESALCAVSYRPVLRGGKPEIDIWTASFVLGDSLPTMPLRIVGDLFVPVEFEATYMDVCRARRLL